MRILFDSNVLISGLLSRQSFIFDLLAKTLKRHSLLYTPFILEEVERVLKNKFQFSDHFVKASLDFIKRQGSRGEKGNKLPIPECRDPDDWQILADAVESHADLIVTGDKDLLTMKSYEGIHILSPRDYSRLL